MMQAGIVYTVGKGRIYRALIALYGTGYKVGRHDDYAGGCVFSSLTDAYRYIDEHINGDPDFVPFGLRAQWGVDTEPSEEGWWHYLLYNREFFALEGISEADRRRRPSLQASDLARGVERLETIVRREQEASQSDAVHDVDRDQPHLYPTPS